MCSPLFTLMRKDKLGFVRSTGPDSIATARLADPCDESEDESNTSCMSTGTVSIAGGDLLCGKLRLLTEELKGKFGRKKSRISIKSTSNESSSLTMQQPLQQETSGTSNDCNNNRSRSNSIAMAALDAANMQDSSTESGRNSSSAPESRSPFVHRALPPLPPVDDDNDVANQLQSDSGHRLLKSNTSTSGLGARTERFNFDSSGDESVNEAPAEFRRLNRHQLSADLPRTSLIAGPTTRFGCTIPPPHLQKPVPPCDASDMDDEDDSDSVEGVHNLSEQVQVTTATNLINLSTNLIQDLATESEPGPICPAIPSDNDEEMRKMLDYAASIEKVKDCGWYWGPISGDKAEKLLANEPDGSFIVRDSSDEHYIFSLTFKLNGSVRHVRIEHDQGAFVVTNRSNKIYYNFY